MRFLFFFLIYLISGVGSFIAYSFITCQSAKCWFYWWTGRFI